MQNGFMHTNGNTSNDGDDGNGDAGKGRDGSTKKQPSNEKIDKDDTLKTPSLSKNHTATEQNITKRGTMTEETCSASTAVSATALTPMSTENASEISSAGSHHDQNIMATQQRRYQLHHQMILLSATTSAAAGIFIVTVLPMMTLIFLGFLAVSAGLLSYTTYQRLLLEYQEIVATGGFGRYLPPGLYQQLTERTLHEFMTDDSFAREWGFMALYFIPGLTQEQIRAYVQRLAPDHVLLLNRRGLGNFFGDGFMRALVGEQHWRQRYIEARVATIEHPNQLLQQQNGTTSTPRRLDFDSDVDSHASAPVGLTIEAGNNCSDNTQIDASSRDEEDAASTTTTNNNDDERQRQLDIEGGLVVSALWDGVWTYATMAASMAGQITYDHVVEPTSSLVTYVGIGVSLLSLGIGYYGISTGYYSRPNISFTSSSQLQPASWMPSSRFVASTAVLGGISAGILLVSRSIIRNTFKPPTPSTKKYADKSE